MKNPAKTSHSASAPWVVKVDIAQGVKRHSRDIHSANELSEVISELIGRREGIALLIEPNSEDYMLFGVAGEFAIVQFCPKLPPPRECTKDDLRPNMWALSNDSRARNSGEYVTFNVGGTATEFPKRYCIDTDTMRKMVSHYYETEQLSDAIEWEKEWLHPSTS